MAAQVSQVASKALKLGQTGLVQLKKRPSNPERLLLPIIGWTHRLATMRCRAAAWAERPSPVRATLPPEHPSAAMSHVA